MPDALYFFDTVVLSNFLLADSTSLLEQRYHGRAFLTGEVFTEIAAGISPWSRRTGFWTR